MHRVKFTSDESMPDGHDFVLASVEGRYILFLRRSALSERVLDQAWAAYRFAAASAGPPPPADSATYSNHDLPVMLRSVS